MSRALPILCSASVVRNILSGAQTEDRRPLSALRPLADGRPSYPQYPVREVVAESKWSRKHQRKVSRDFLHVHNGSGDGAGWWLPAPWSAGDTLYVRETWQLLRLDYDAETGHVDDVEAVADVSTDPRDPRFAGRPRYSVAYAANAGWDGDKGFPWRPSIHMPKWAARIHLRVLSVGVERVGDITEAGAKAEGCADVEDFARLWIKLYGIWSDNPWVWVTKFERVRP
mgnify:CR=1 FL=1